ncbi:MAG: peptidoglycan-binding protein [Patescibacteria group bacterium]
MRNWHGIVLGLFLIAIPSVTLAHPGRTDSSGCHTCRTNCPKWGLSTGEYHCHNAKALPQPKEPIRSHYDESGGTTEPWPEYKAPSAKSVTVPTVNKSPTISLPTTAPSAKTTITYTLAKGMENNQVSRLQQVLVRYPDIYPESSTTGYFGPATERAVKGFQKKHGLEQTGAVGPKTRALLNAL